MKSKPYQRISALVVDGDLKRRSPFQQRALRVLKQLAFRRSETGQFLKSHNDQRACHTAIEFEVNSLAFVVLDLEIDHATNGIDLYLGWHAQPPTR